VIYAYGICEPAVAAQVARRRGLGGATLRAVERGGLAAIYTRHRSIRPRPIPKLVLEHERVVEAIMAAGAVLPVRFGTELAREEELAAVLDDRRDELLRSLDGIRGRVEVGVRVTPEHRPLGRRAIESSGRDYLLARVREHSHRQQAIREMHDQLVMLSEAARVLPARPPAILAASYLVESDRVTDFRLHAHQLARRLVGMRVTVTGPWPPYSFATEEPR
jgi:Gas vesicle synthesis protein GvpL/GvpF